MDIYQSIREKAYAEADRYASQRANELNVPVSDMTAWLNGKRVETVELAMLRETDDLGRRPLVHGRS